MQPAPVPFPTQKCLSRQDTFKRSRRRMKLRCSERGGGAGSILFKTQSKQTLVDPLMLFINSFCLPLLPPVDRKASQNRAKFTPPGALPPPTSPRITPRRALQQRRRTRDDDRGAFDR
jgi:hypothetical protein